MIECRLIQLAEGAAYLRALCRIFDLDYVRAESIFYHEPFFDLNRKWALFCDGFVRSILTTVPLQFGDGAAIGIAGVGTLVESRGKGYGQTLVEAALESATKDGETRALLFAQSDTLYKRCGFETLDRVIRADFTEVEVDPDAEVIGFERVRELYDAWALRDPKRLQRDDRRWNFWKWNLRMCVEVPGGYVCQEGDLVREVVLDQPPPRWPIFEQAEWFGLRTMAQELRLPLKNEREDLMFMGRGFTEVPRLYMTDQF